MKRHFYRKCRSKRPLKRKNFLYSRHFFSADTKKRSSRPDVSINFLQVYWCFFCIHSIGIGNNKGVKSILKSFFRQGYKITNEYYGVLFYWGTTDYELHIQKRRCTSTNVYEFCSDALFCVSKNNIPYNVPWFPNWGYAHYSCG